MKILHVLLLLLVGHLCFSQKVNKPDSLEKYSYTVMGFNGTPNGAFGTCFFMKDQESIYFITAKHTFYDCDSSSNKIVRKYSQAILVPDGNTPINILIPPSRMIDTCLSMDKDTDLLVIKIDKKWERYLNTVEKFMLPLFDKTGDIEIFGQGMRSDSIIAFEKQHHVHIDKKQYTIYSTAPTQDSSHIDSVHALIELKNISTGRWLKGFSGSPVFLQHLKTKEWRVMGVFNIMYDDKLLPQGVKGAIEIIKSEYITKSILELK